MPSRGMGLAAVRKVSDARRAAPPSESAAPSSRPHAVRSVASARCRPPAGRCTRRSRRPVGRSSNRAPDDLRASRSVAGPSPPLPVARLHALWRRYGSRRECVGTTPVPSRLFYRRRGLGLTGLQADRNQHRRSLRGVPGCGGQGHSVRGAKERLRLVVDGFRGVVHRSRAASPYLGPAAISHGG
jgi:hypothetical protein